MSKRARTLLYFMLLLPVLAAAWWIGSCELRRSGLQAGYDVLGIGDSRERVIELMGQPKETEPCLRRDSSNNSAPECTRLLYYSLFERWIIYVDSKNEVIDKINNEGSF